MTDLSRMDLGPFELLPEGMAVHDGRDLILADLHIGYEADQGPNVSMPIHQTGEILARVETILEARPGLDRVVLAGDIKHAFGKTSFQERREVRSFVDALRAHAEVVVIRGNHDRFLETILPAGITFEDRFHLDEEKRVLVVHGHEEAPRADWTITGHVHPVLRVRDEVGALVRTQCFLVTEDALVTGDDGLGMVVLPAQNPWSGGGDVLHPSTLGERFSPVAALWWDALFPAVWSGQDWLPFPALRRWSERAPALE